MIGADSTNATRSTTLEMTLKRSADYVDIGPFLDIHDVVLPLVLDGKSIGILTIVSIAGVGGGEGDIRSAVRTKSIGIDRTSMNEGLDERQVGRDRKTAEDHLADFGS